MIFAIEGPDKSGKSTLVLYLKTVLSGVYCGGLPLPPELMPVMQFVEQRQEALWRQLYVPEMLYIADRSFCVSAEVYSKLFGRSLLFNPAPWRKEHFVVYLDCPENVLNFRYDLSGGDEHFPKSRYQDVRAIYDEVLLKYDHIILDALKSTEELAWDCLCAIASKPIGNGGYAITAMNQLRSRLSASTKH